MKQDAILGGTGFVGSHIREIHPNASIYNSKNICDIKGEDFGTVYCACIPAIKWKANKNSDEDMAAISSIQNILSTMSCERFVLISTIDVHDNSNPCKHEDDDSNWSSEPYGKNRKGFEDWVKHTFDNFHIIRLPALYGIGLKKNIIFDFLNENRLEYIPKNSSFQWYDLNWLNEDIAYVLKNEIRIANLYPEPVDTEELVSKIFPRYSDVIASNDTRISYSHGTKFDRFKREKMEVLTSIRKFVDMYGFIHSDKISRLAVSSLVWGDKKYDPHAFFVMKRYGIHNMELVPMMYDKEDGYDISKLKRYLEGNGISVVSQQAVLFGIDGTIESSKDAILRRMKLIDLIGKQFNARFVVFGSPKLRQNIQVGNLINLLKDIKESCPNLEICLEPNSREYGCEIGINMKEVFEISSEADVCITADTGNAYMEKDEIQSYMIPRCTHSQISAPYLRNINDDITVFSQNYLKDVRSRYVTLESKTDIENMAFNVRSFIEIGISLS